MDLIFLLSHRAYHGNFPGKSGRMHRIPTYMPRNINQDSPSKTGLRFEKSMKFCYFSGPYQFCYQSEDDFLELPDHIRVYTWFQYSYAPQLQRRQTKLHISLILGVFYFELNHIEHSLVFYWTGHIHIGNTHTPH